jgi:hypothetical protein
MEPVAGGSGRNRPWRHSSPSPADAHLLKTILRDFAWPYGAIVADPLGRFVEPQHEHWRYLLCLFDDNDIVWIGRDIYDSGKPSHLYRFRKAVDWPGMPACPGRLICPNTFLPGSFNRADSKVLKTKFLVVESDELNRNEVGAIFRWLENAYPEMTLRAIVDTAGKSLHGWFDYPSPTVLEEVRDFLPRLKCDPAMFTPSQPCRLPGALRGNAYQRLIYFNHPTL